MEWFLESIIASGRKIGSVALVALLLGTGTVQATDNSSHPDASGTFVSDGMLIYYAVLPAGMVRGFLPGSTEARMHGGVPRGSHWHHVLVALMDKNTGERIVGATVLAKISELGLATETLSLEPVVIDNAESFMNYYQFDKTGIYTIKLEIERRGGASPVLAEFRYRHH